MDVTIYTTPTCKFCDMTKKFFSENNVTFNEINVREDEKAKEEAIRKSGQRGVPVIDAGGEIIIGYDKPALKKALKLK